MKVSSLRTVLHPRRLHFCRVQCVLLTPLFVLSLSESSFLVVANKRWLIDINHHGSIICLNIMLNSHALHIQHCTEMLMKDDLNFHMWKFCRYWDYKHCTGTPVMKLSLYRLYETMEQNICVQSVISSTWRCDQVAWFLFLICSDGLVSSDIFSAINVRTWCIVFVYLFNHINIMLN